MRKGYEVEYHKLEDSLWWFLARRDIFSRLLSFFPRDSKILEVGCASGALLQHLARQGFTNLWGVDISEEAVRRARDRGLARVAIADAVALPFESGTFDIVVSSDVLEHIPNDEGAVKEWARVLKPGGTLFLFVPAHPFLWSAHDEVNEHLRRYRKEEVLDLLEKAGFVVDRASYWNMLMFFPIAFVRLLLHIAPKHARGEAHQLHELPAPINKAITFVIRLENILVARGITMPTGVSFFAIARKTARFLEPKT